MTTLTLHNPGEDAADVPVTCGVPLPRGLLFNPSQIILSDSAGRHVPLQSAPLARWSDESVQWLLVDFVAPHVPQGTSDWALTLTHATAIKSTDDDSNASQGQPPFRAVPHRHGFDLLTADYRPLATLRFPFLTESGQRIEPKITGSRWEAKGPVRSTLAVGGVFPRCRALRFHARLHVFAGTGLVRLEVRLHNPNPARHPGGLWDLGDPGSIHFRSFHLETSFAENRGIPEAKSASAIAYRLEPHGPIHTASGAVEILQESSGGPAWNCSTHLDRHGKLPIAFHGYRVRASGDVDDSRPAHTGLRATPTVACTNAGRTLSVTVPEFWQQFPKSLSADSATLHAGLFPFQDGRLFELQGGERKTHTVWLSTSSSNDQAGRSLAFAHQPIRPTLSPEWHARAKCPSVVTPAEHDSDRRLADFLCGALSGELNLASRRDSIDEYGWRNFGDVPADHEQEFYPGPETVVSHYNNQFDLIYGGIAQLARTGNPHWFDLFDPLARHVVDVDIYHTERDRPAYNGGLFWHTDHYRTAGTSSHRAYTRLNRQPGSAYGGGPSNEHNYTSGLLHYYWLTGNPDAREAVLTLANWVISRDDGRESLFAALDDGPTGLATATTDENYHGPGRGAGNSLNALTDAWLLTRERRWLDAGEAIIRRVVHPAEDVGALNLLNAELRWSYTVFFVALAKWLDTKAEAGELDDAYAYGQAAFLHFVRWMAAHERPYFDRPAELEYETSAWAAQELRKANVLRLAARHADEPERTQFLDRGDRLADRAWTDLERFENRFVARSLSILMTEGAREAWLRDGNPPPAPRVAPPSSWPERVHFVPQKARVRAVLRNPAKAFRAALKLLNPLVWPHTFRQFLRHR